MYVLEARQGDVKFRKLWRRFVRSVVRLLPELPPEAGQWWNAADAYESGQLDGDGLWAVQHDAMHYLFSLPQETPDARYCAISAATQPLWDLNTGGGWFDGAWGFLQDCTAAGVEEAAWWPLFWAAFPEFAGGSDPAA